MASLNTALAEQAQNAELMKKLYQNLLELSSKELDCYSVVKHAVESWDQFNKTHEILKKQHELNPDLGNKPYFALNQYEETKHVTAKLMSALMDYQSKCTQEITRISVNYGKDSEKRKNKKYCQLKLEKLEKYWLLVCANNEALQWANKDDEYFKAKLFEKIKQTYLALFDKIKEKMATFNEQQDEEDDSEHDEEDGEDTERIQDEQQKARVKLQKIKLAKFNQTLAKISENISTWSQATRSRHQKGLQAKWEEIESADDEIQLHASETDSIEQYFQTYDRTKEKFAEIQEEMEQYIENFNMPTKSSQIKLQPLQIQKFSGDYTQWHTFYETFIETTKKANCSPLEAMHYLMNSLEGEARRMVRHLNISAENYNDALIMLKNRFDNNRKITTAYIDEILDIPNLCSKNSATFVNMHDKIIEVLLNLEKLNHPVQSWDVILANLLLKKFDYVALTQFEETLKDPKVTPTTELILKFLMKRYDTMESLKDKKGFGIEQRTKPRQTLATVSRSCKFCKKDHPLYACNDFKGQSIQTKRHFVTKNEICRKCLSHNYKKKCQSRLKCLTCKGLHHTLLHEDHKEKADGQEAERKTKTSNLALTEKTDVEVLLATALITVKNSANKYKHFRALIDQGSQVTMITEEAAKKLNIKRSKTDTGLIGMCKSDAGTAKHQLTFSIKPRFESTFELTATALIREYLTVDLPTNKVKSHIKLPTLNLADPTWKKPGQIDIVIGADYFGKIIKPGLKDLGQGLIAQDTAFGWIISGPIHLDQAFNKKKAFTTTTEDQNINEIEQLLENQPLKSKIDSNAEIDINFINTTTRNKEGRYIVRIPFMEDKNLGASREGALARFFSLESKLDRNPSLKQQYVQFMRDYQKQGHMSRINTKEGKYYLPHHAVIKEDSDTTKLRVVFDGSYKSSNGRSVNDIMFKGQNLLQDISQLLTRWRTHKYVFSADIEKMFRQILIHPDDRKFQCILWRESTNEPVKEFKLNTVTYGTSSASYLAIRTLKKIANDTTKFKDAAEVLENDFYMDDCLSGRNSVKETQELAAQLIALLKEAGMNLRKFASNHPDITKNLPKQLLRSNTLEFNKNELKMLGIRWNSLTDTFTFKTNMEDTKSTKRQILSAIASIYDPLGWLAPVIFKAKKHLQSIWEQQCEWDDDIPEDLHREWSKFASQINKLENIKIARFIGDPESQQIIGFCDASEEGYGAVVYSIHYQPDQTKKISLIAAKTKISSKENRQTIPRQELDGALLLAELVSKIANSFKICKKPILFTDSKVVLGWLKSNKQRSDPYITNRVQKIRTNKWAADWRYVPSSDNPADCASRGLNPEILITFDLWWNGPAWLKKDIAEWPTQQIEKTAVVNLNVIQQRDERKDMFERYSSFRKQARIFAYMYRFINNMKNSASKSRGYLTCEELENAKIKLIEYAQEEFNQEMKLLKLGKPLPKSSKLARLNPFCGNDGIVRVGGRLAEADIPINTKNPIILPRGHIASTIIKDEHERQKHAGSSLTLNALRATYWVIGGKAAVNTVIHKCVKCARMKGKTSEQMMGNLPAARIIPSPPFSSTGIDFAGPFNTRASGGRGIKTNKSYIAVFICMVTKALHLELVNGLDTASFMGAFRRFISRRGSCKDIYSDNGTNFKGAANQLDSELKAAISAATSHAAEEVANNKINWHFIPPGSPHFGGLWEAAVKSVKKLLLDTVGDSSLTYEEFYTVLTETEACLNSRPLTPLTNDAEDLEALTPGHFIIGRPLTAPPEKSLEDLALHKKWELIKKYKAEIWKRWRNEYLSMLQKRHKWQNTTPNLKIGELVLIKDEETPPLKWPLARITSVNPGKDGLVRVVEIKMADKKLRLKPITKICKLPIEIDTPTEERLSHITTKANEVSKLKLKPSSKEIISQITTKEGDDKEEYVDELIRSQEQSRKRVAPRIWMRQPASEKIRRMTTAQKVGLMITTILALCLNQVYASRTNTTIIQAKPGLYIEKIGDLTLNRGQLRLDLAINKTTIDNDIKNTKNTLQRYKDICQKTTQATDDYHCKHWQTTFQEKLNRINNAQNIVLNGQIRSRKPRGVLGGILQSVFGVNEEVYESIDNLEKNQHNLIKKANHQNKLLISSLQEINLTNTRHLSELDNKIKLGIESINEMQQWYKSINKEKINQHMMMITMDAKYFLDEMDTKYNTIANAIKGKATITDFMNLDEIEKIIEGLQKRLPTDVLIDSIPANRIKISRNISHVIIHGFMELKEFTSFEIMAVTGIPSYLGNNEFMTSLADTKIIAIDYNRQRYFNTTIANLMRCDQHEIHYLCSTNSIHNLEHEKGCLTDYLLGRKESWNCPMHHFKSNVTVWKKLMMDDTWLIITSNSLWVAVLCNGHREEINIKQTTIIKVNSGCVIKTKDVTLYNLPTIGITVEGTYQKEINDSSSHIEPETETLKNIQHISTIINPEEPYIPKLELQPYKEKAWKHDVKTHATSGAGTVAIIVTLYILWKSRNRITMLCKRNKYSIESTTTPTPCSMEAATLASPGQAILDSHNLEETTTTLPGQATLDAHNMVETTTTLPARTFPSSRRWEHVHL